MGKIENVQGREERGRQQRQGRERRGKRDNTIQKQQYRVESGARETVGGRQRNATENRCSQRNCPLRGSLILLSKGLKTTSVDTDCGKGFSND